MGILIFRVKQRAAVHCCDRGFGTGQERGSHPDTLGPQSKSIKSSVEHYNKAVGSLDQRVVASARRMKELGVGAADDPVALGPVEATPRALQSPEFSAPSEPADV